MASNMLTDVLSIGSLTSLKTLDLSSNNIANLPKVIHIWLCIVLAIFLYLYYFSLLLLLLFCLIFQDISYLRHVQELSLSKNEIKSLPESLSGLCMLKNLSLSQNKVPLYIYIILRVAPLIVFLI